MTIDEAIEIKEAELEGSVEHSEEELCRAEMLGIEALKRYRDLRWRNRIPDWDLLPSETEE